MPLVAVIVEGEMTRRRMGVAAAALLLAGMLSACGSTPYQPEGLTGGYTDSKIDSTTWAVKFGGNGYSSMDEVFVFWLYRCAEITVREGYTHFVRIDRSAGVAPPRSSGGAYRWAAPALPMQQPRVEVKGGGYIFVPMYYDSTPKPSVQGVIRLYREGEVPDVERSRAYDAKLVMREHAGRAKRPPPELNGTAPANRPGDAAPAKE